MSDVKMGNLEVRATGLGKSLGQASPTKSKLAIMNFSATGLLGKSLGSASLGKSQGAILNSEGTGLGKSPD